MSSCMNANCLDGELVIAVKADERLVFGNWDA